MAKDFKRNVLIVGAVSQLAAALCERFAKEGIHAYLLTDDKKRKLAGADHIFRMRYDSDSVREVIAACRPDALIYTGAYDIRFAWSKDSEIADYRYFTGGCCHLLAAAEGLSVRRFLFLSSECVFSDHAFSAPDEDAAPDGDTLQAKAVALCEAAARYYGAHYSMETAVLRLDGVYYPPADAGECAGRCLEMCLEAVRDGRIRCNGKVLRGALYVNDAAEALLQAVNAVSFQRDIYHVTGGAPVGEDRIADCIARASSSQVEIEDETSGVARSRALGGDAFAREFHFAPHYSLEAGLQAVIAFMQRYVSRFSQGGSREAEEGKQKNRWFHKLYPFLESMGVFLLAAFLQRGLAGNENFARLDFFLLYVVLFATMHGLTQAIFASSLSVLGYLFIRQMGQDLLSVLMDVSVYLWIAQLFIIGMSIGMLRDQLVQLRQDKDDEIGYLNERLADITSINASTTQIKNYFEQQVINSSESMGFFHDIVKRLDEANENETVFIAVQILEKAMHTDCVTIYLLGDVYGRLLSGSGGAAARLGKSIKLEDYPMIFEPLRNREIYINRALDPELPSMAAGIWNGENRLQHVILVWKLPYDRMTLDGSNLLRILALLLSNAISRAEKYLSAVSEKQYFPRTRVMRPEAFREIYQVYEKNFETTGQSFSVLLALNDYDGPEDVNGKLLRFLRTNDHVGRTDGGQYLVLLANTTQEEARRVAQRFMAGGNVTRVLREEEILPFLKAKTGGEGEGC